MIKIVSEAVQRANRNKGNVIYQQSTNMKHRRLETAASKWNWTSTSIRRCSIARLYWEVTLHSNKTRRSATLFHHFDIVNSFWPVKLYSIFDQHLVLVVSIATPIVSALNKSLPCWKHKLPDRSIRDSLPFFSKETPEICHSAVFCHPLLNGSTQNIPTTWWRKRCPVSIPGTTTRSVRLSAVTPAQIMTLPPLYAWRGCTLTSAWRSPFRR